MFICYIVVMANVDLIKVFVHILIVYVVLGFNIDTEKAIVYTSIPGSYFGTTTEIINNTQGNWLLVGAPRTNSTEDSVRYAGAIYRCPIEVNDTIGKGCEILEGYRYNTSSTNSEENQGLGLSLSVLDDLVLMCAPTWLSDKGEKNPGRCTRADKTFSRFTSQRFRLPSYEYDNAEFGFSIYPAKGNNVIAVCGIPNFFGTKGGFFHYTDIDHQYTGFANLFVSTSIKDYNEIVRFGDYLGYSIASGEFGGSTNLNDYPTTVVSAPGFANEKGVVGMIAIFEITQPVDVLIAEMKKQIAGSVAPDDSICRKALPVDRFIETPAHGISTNIPCEALGGGFGQSLCVADFNGDQLDDIAVGAPLEYMENAGEHSEHYAEEGSVYVFYGTRDQPDQPKSYVSGNKQTLKGKRKIRSRFGTSIISLGDITMDNINDMAVGAPYEDDMQGAVYIFKGGNSRITSEYTQRIPASQIGDSFRGFGYSLSRSPLDIDQNTYRDISVGAYLSSNTVVLRTRPIVTMTVNLTLTPDIMPLNSTNESCNGTSYRPCTSLTVCFNYSGIGVNNGLYIDYTVNSDVRVVNRRKSSRYTLYVDGTDMGPSHSIQEVFIGFQENVCHDIEARVVKVDQQFFQLLTETSEFSVSYSLSNRSIGSEVKPIFDTDAKTSSSISGTFMDDCNSTCSSDLILTITTVPEDLTLVVGDTNELILEVNIINIRDPAEQVLVTISSLPDIPYSRYTVLLEQGSVDVTCLQIPTEGSSTVQCSLGKSLYAHQVALFRVIYDVSKENLFPRGVVQEDLTGSFNITGEVVSTSQEISPSDANAYKSVQILINSTLQIYGSSEEDQVIITARKDAIISLQQSYTITNAGPSPVPDIQIIFEIPTIVQEKILVKQDHIQVTPHDSANNCSMVTYASSGDSKDASTTSSQSEITQSIACVDADVQCARLICVISSLDVGAHNLFTVLSNISENAIPEFKSGVNRIDHYTYMKVQSPENPKITKQLSFEPSQVSVVLKIFPQNISTLATEINLWPVIVGSIVGLVLIILILIILWRCGFFKRKRREEIQEYKRKSYLHQRQSRALQRSTRVMARSSDPILPGTEEEKGGHLET